MDLVKMFSAPTIVPALIMLILVKTYVALFGAATPFNPASRIIIVMLACIMILTAWNYMLKGVDMDL